MVELASMDTVISRDGTVIGSRQMGTGPGVVIVHGAFRASQHYLRLATALSDRFTVTIMDRRGRNASGPKGADYSMQKECEDVIAVLRQQRAEFLFGHSYGGLVGLEVARQYPLAKLALYEPAVFMKDFLSSVWMPRFERELGQQDYVSASLTFIKGMQIGGGIFGRLPRPILRLMFSAAARGPEWEENIPLLLTLPEEFRAGLAVCDEGQYRSVQTETLVLSGAKSPAYLSRAAQALLRQLPNGRSVCLPGVDHNAPDEGAPEVVARELLLFFEIA